jgi:hypothetical protein
MPRPSGTRFVWERRRPNAVFRASDLARLTGCREVAALGRTAEVSRTGAIDPFETKRALHCGRWKSQERTLGALAVASDCGEQGARLWL